MRSRLHDELEQKYFERKANFVAGVIGVLFLGALAIYLAVSVHSFMMFLNR